MTAKAKIKTLLFDLLQDQADFALLFGSWSGDDGHITVESDVDCGAFFHPHIVADRSWFDLCDRFEYATGQKLDLICLNTADIIIASQIVATAEVVFTHSAAQLLIWQAQVMSRYVDFKQSRKIIEENILVRPNHEP